jgi:chromosome segregation ATPase
MSDGELLKRVARAEQEAEQALERAAEAGRKLLDAEARAASDRAAVALADDALTEARRAAASVETRHAREVEELRAEIARLEGELEKHRQWLVSIQSSTSWKITRPLRSLR